MKILLWLVGVVLVATVIAVVWQHGRYLEARRNAVDDRQRLVYSSSALHVVTLLKLAPGTELIPEMARFRKGVEDAGARVVYAGKTALIGLRSSQLPVVDWDAILLAQHLSPEEQRRVSASPDYQKLLGSFAQTYELGMKRPVALNMAVPIALLAIRAFDLVRGRPAQYPFEPAVRSDLDPELAERRARFQQLEGERELGSRAVVVVNFVKNGDAEQREANRGYVFEMFRLMAERGYGPMHIGDAVTLEGDAEFDSVVLVYYPGVDYFSQMAQSSFFNGIIDGKQLGDTQAIITVPLLSKLPRL